MGKIGDHVQSADWKSEKHAPVIECEDTVSAGQSLVVTAQVGKEIAHPNTGGHHISWINLYFKPADEKFTYHVGNYEFNSHGASASGEDDGPVVTEPCVTASFKPKKSGTIFAMSYCNIHGLWESSKEITVS